MRTEPDEFKAHLVRLAVYENKVRANMAITVIFLRFGQRMIHGSLRDG